jgi:hypothetical protein
MGRSKRLSLPNNGEPEGVTHLFLFKFSALWNHPRTEIRQAGLPAQFTVWPFTATRNRVAAQPPNSQTEDSQLRVVLCSGRERVK